MSFGSAIGVVESFDDEVGLGVIVDEAAGRWPFHCTVIADGSRTIAAGTRVRFERATGGPGRWEAFHIER